MWKIVYFAMIILVTTGWFACDGNEHILQTEELDQPSAMNVYCQSSPGSVLWRCEYEYDNNRLIAETKISNNGEQSRTTYRYNDKNQLAQEIYASNLQKTEKTYLYNGKGQLIKIEYTFTNFDINGQVASEYKNEATFEYENNLLVKELEYWGGYNTYEYKNGQLYKKTDYTKMGQEHHITYYTYSRGLLSEEKKVTVTGNILYHKVYLYDSGGRLLKIKDGDNIIEENSYKQNKLIEKREYYFGIDPGYSPCYGNFIYTYEY
jgi:hypothetical protein